MCNAGDQIVYCTYYNNYNTEVFTSVFVFKYFYNILR
nr:MAG TPA: hypothetical protein [Caudoviricetes sp.]